MRDLILIFVGCSIALIVVLTAYTYIISTMLKKKVLAHELHIPETEDTPPITILSQDALDEIMRQRPLHDSQGAWDPPLIVYDANGREVVDERSPELEGTTTPTSPT